MIDINPSTSKITVITVNENGVNMLKDRLPERIKKITQKYDVYKKPIVNKRLRYVKSKGIVIISQ